MKRRYWLWAAIVLIGGILTVVIATAALLFFPPARPAALSEEVAAALEEVVGRPERYVVLLPLDCFQGGETLVDAVVLLAERLERGGVRTLVTRGEGCDASDVAASRGQVARAEQYLVLFADLNYGGPWAELFVRASCGEGCGQGGYYSLYRFAGHWHHSRTG